MNAVWIILGLAAVVGVTGYGLVRYALVFPLMHRPDASPRTPRHDQDPRMSALRSHLNSVATVPHNTHHYAALELAADYITGTLTAFGHMPETQSFVVDGNTPVRNIVVCLKADPASSAQDVRADTIVIGAHYDSAGHSPGANDNGTGVAALLEICRDLVDYRPANRNVKLVFFVNEEAPYCKTPDMGSWRCAEMLIDRGENIIGMMALETLGYFSDASGSQHFPFPFNHIYDDRGDFVAFVGLSRGRGFTHAATRAFRETQAFPSIGGIAPSFVSGIDLSDHWSFNAFGIPASMIVRVSERRRIRDHQGRNAKRIK
ncbi:MAG: M28 family peptidase [Pseudomonadota bacterium]